MVLSTGSEKKPESAVGSNRTGDGVVSRCAWRESRFRQSPTHGGRTPCRAPTPRWENTIGRARIDLEARRLHSREPAEPLGVDKTAVVVGDSQPDDFESVFLHIGHELEDCRTTSVLTAFLADQFRDRSAVENQPQLAFCQMPEVGKVPDRKAATECGAEGEYRHDDAH